MVKPTGNKNNISMGGSKNKSDTEKDTNKLKDNSVQYTGDFEVSTKKAEECAFTGGKFNMDASELMSVQAMKVLNGFTPLGMLFVLMEILNGAEEGLIRVNRLAEALSIGKPAMLAQLERLENAGLIRTVSSSQRGRHIELLVTNLVAGRNIREVSDDDVSLPVFDAVPKGAPPNFSLDALIALRNYLTTRGIRVAGLHEEAYGDFRLPQIATFMGKHLSYLLPFYTRLKATLNDGGEVQFSLSGLYGRDASNILNFCKMLQRAGFLAAFTYRRAPDCMIIARVGRTPEAINFLSGGWLEYYIRDKVTAVLTTHPATMDLPFAFMKNPKIVLPGDEDFEFDFLLMIKDKVFWIEAKTGDYMHYIGKYSRVSKLLGLNKNSSLLVLVGAPKPDINVSARYGISCCGVDEFSDVFRLGLIRELNRPGP